MDKRIERFFPWALALAVGAVVGLGISFALSHGADQGAIVWARRWPFALAPIVVAMGFVHFHFDRRRVATMAFTRSSDLRVAGATFMNRMVHLPRALRVVALALLVLAMARPQRPSADLAEVEGIDIVIALDVSNSMSERDLQPNRLEAAKEVLQRFIERRKSDRIGLVIFGSEAFTQCPLTLDYHALERLLADIRLNLIDGRSTAIGNALGTALNRLRKSDAKSKVIILLTDGDNNAGNLAPLTAARYAQSLGVRVFTVLMGRDVANAPSVDPFGNLLAPPTRYPVNPRLLEEIAGQTGGTPYLATDKAALERRFQSILDELDRSRIKDQKGRPIELYATFLIPAIGLLLLELALSLTRFRRFP